MLAETSSDEPSEGAGDASDAGADERWMSWYEALRKFPADASGKRDVPQHYVLADGRRLGKWYTYQRQRYKNGEISVAQVALLEALGMVWSAHASLWEEGLSQFKSFKPNRSVQDSQKLDCRAIEHSQCACCLRPAPRDPVLLACLPSAEPPASRPASAGPASGCHQPVL